MLDIVDEFTRGCLAIRVDRKLNPTAVIDVLIDLFVLRGVPGHGRPACTILEGCAAGHSPRLIAVPKEIRPEVHRQGGEGLDCRSGAKTAFIGSGTPWENGYCEIFYSLSEAWRVHCNTARRHSSWLPAACAGGRPRAVSRQWITSTPGDDIAAETRHALRLKPDQPTGAGQAWSAA